MKRKIKSDEWYPVYSLAAEDEYGGWPIEVTEDQVERWESARAAFEVAQSEMADLHNAAQAVGRERAQAEKARREAQEKAEREERNRQQQVAAAERQRRVDALVGTVYDAEGKPVGVVQPGNMGLTIRPVED